MDHRNLNKATVSPDACRHLRPRLCIELVRAWNEFEKHNGAALTWGGLIDLFNANSPNPYADEIRKSRDAVLGAAEVDKIRDEVTAMLDARLISNLYPSKKAHEAMRLALFDAKMASGGKRLYELFFHDLELSDCAGSVRRAYGKMLRIVETGVADWPIGQKLAEHILECGLKKDGLTLAHLKDSTRDGKKTLADAKLESSMRGTTKFFFVLPIHRTSHA